MQLQENNSSTDKITQPSLLLKKSPWFAPWSARTSYYNGDSFEYQLKGLFTLETECYLRVPRGTTKLAKYL